MAPADAASPEQPILRARARGEVSCDAAFERLYALYAPVVLGWLAMRVERPDADDLAQDAWSIFYRRWRGWRFLPEMEAPGARPVLSFLYRTAYLVEEAHRRRTSRPHQSLEEVELADGRRAPERMIEQVEMGRCLELARRICPSEELDVLLAKLAGVPAREIARALEITEPMVDHRFRDAVARLQKELQPERENA